MIDQDLLEQIQYTMIEPPTGGVSWPSGLWTPEEVYDYLNERLDAFVKATHIKIAIDDITIIPNTGRYSLPADWIATVRAYYEPQVGTNKALVRSSGWEADHGIPTWPSQATPKLYMDAETPTLTIQLAPTPDTDGTLEVIYIANNPQITADGATLPFADEFCTFVKYGVMADMFSKVGRAHDPIRAEYCQQRFDLGIEATRILLNGFRS